MDKQIFTSLTAPELRALLKEELSNYFQENPLRVKVKNQNEHERLTRKQVCEEYKISLGTVHNLMKQGKLAYHKVGRKTLFRREDVEHCINGKRVSHEPS